MRAIWKGNISFALVSIPISLFSATRRNELSFHYLHTMRFAHEIVDAGSLNLPAKADISKKEMDLANTLIDSMSDKFDPSRYRDDYYDKVLEIIQMKIAGVSPQAPAPKGPGPAQVV